MMYTLGKCQAALVLVARQYWFAERLVVCMACCLMLSNIHSCVTVPPLCWTPEMFSRTIVLEQGFDIVYTKTYRNTNV